MSNKKTEGYKLGVGLDIGTMNIVSARQNAAKAIETNRIRDAFLDLDADAKRALRMSKVDYIEKNGALIVIGDSALTMANLFKREARRPLSRGVISAGEIDAQEVLSLLTAHVLGAPQKPKEHCFYSVPASPLDDPGQDVLYHQEVFRKILLEHGYEPHPMNEAMAIIFSQCAEENFSGLAVSFGSGMCNIALSYQATKALEFSLARGGDWIDQHSAKAVGKTASQMCAVKERGIDLLKPEGREQEAVVLYIRAMIDYCLKNIAEQFKKVKADVDLPDPIPFVISGGTTKAHNFLEIFQEEFEKMRKTFPIKISAVRPATDPLTAVAEGLLVLAMEEHEG